MPDKKISELDAASNVNSDAIFPFSQLFSGDEETFKATISQIGSYIANSQEFNALNTTSKKLINAINEIAAGGGGTSFPELLYAVSGNRTTIQNFSYTFTESGKYQYYAFITTDSIASGNEITFQLNGNTITPTFDTGFFYGEVTVSANDVFTATTTSTQNGRGVQLYIIKGADISNFRIVGSVSNNNSTFTIDTTSPYLQCYRYGYNGTNNNFQYQIGKHEVKYDTGGFQYIQSIPTPNQSAYYRGGTWVIQI